VHDSTNSHHRSPLLHGVLCLPALRNPFAL
jgi:hypothetical protein